MLYKPCSLLYMTYSFLSFVFCRLVPVIIPLMLCIVYCRAETSVVRSVGDLNRVIGEMAMSLETDRKLRIEGEYSNKTFERLVSESIYADFATQWFYRYKSASSVLNFRLVYRDSTRILAAHLNQKLKKELTIKEKKALKEFSARVSRFKYKHMKRSDKVRAIYEDSRLRRISTRTGREDCADFYITRHASDMTFAYCVDMLLKAHGIPSRVVIGRWGRFRSPADQGRAVCWSMVQLEDGKWYHVVPFGVTESLFLDDKGILANYSWPRDVYPEAKQSFQGNPCICGNHRTFWKEAQKAHDRGEKSYTAIIGRYRGKKKFEESFTEFIEGGGSLSIAEKYLPGTEADDVLVHVIFSADEEEEALDEKVEDSSESELKAGKDALKKFKNLVR